MEIVFVNFTQAGIRVLLLTALLLLSGFGSVNAQQLDFAQVVSKLSSKLELDEGQSKKLGSSIEAYMKQLDSLFAEQEAEDADPSLLIDGVRNAQASFESSLASFMTKDQFDKYQDLKEQAIKTMLGDLAATQLMDAQPKTTITDNQIAELAPVLGDTFYSIMQIAWENAGKKLRPGQKVGIARKLKSIQGNLQKGLEQILTPEQQQAWEAHKAQESS